MFQNSEAGADAIWRNGSIKRKVIIMVRCVKCSKEITSVKNIRKITSVPSTEKGVVDCICKQCAGETAMAEILGRSYKPCIRCRKTNVEALPFSVHEEDEMCEWCRLALKAGIDDFKLFREVEETKRNPYINMDDDELEAQFGLEDLEDYGAFTDEGIMPSCHSDSEYGYEMREMEKYSRRMKEIGRLIKAVREKMGLSIAQLAKAVDMSEYIEQNIENGEVCFLHKETPTPAAVVPVSAASRTVGNNNGGLNGEHFAEAKKWWEACDENELREEVWKYLYIHCAS